MMRWQKEAAVPVAKAQDLPPEERRGRIVTGVLVDREAPEYVAEYAKLCERAREANQAKGRRPPKAPADRRDMAANEPR